MDVDLVSDLFIAAIVVAAAVLKTWQLCQDPADRPLRAITVGLWGMAIALTLGLSELRDGLDDRTSGFVTVVVNWAMMTAATALVLFFVWSARPANAARVARRIMVAFAVAVAVMGLAWASGDAFERLHMVGKAAAGRWNTTLFVATVLGYTQLCWWAGFVYAARYWGRAARFRTRLSLAFVTAGMAGMTVYSLGGLIRALMRIWLPPDTPFEEFLSSAYIVGKGAGQTLIVIGMCVAGLLAAIEQVQVRRRQQAAADALAPLRNKVEEQFPDVVLHRQRQTGVKGSYYRSVIEIRDALVELGPYYPRAATAPTETSVAAAARIVADGFRAHKRGDIPQPGPHPQVGPDTDTSLAGDTAWLVGLADELDRQGFYEDASRSGA